MPAGRHRLLQSSPAKAGDPVRRGPSIYHQNSRILDRPPSRTMTIGERLDVNAVGLDVGTFAGHLCVWGVHPKGGCMRRRIVFCLGVAVAGLMAAAPADARRRQIDATPFSHAPCSVLDGTPCTPTFCSVFNHGPCIPEIFYPYGENLQLTIQSAPAEQDAAKYVRPDHDLDTIGDLFAALRSCWSPPAAERAREDTRAAYLNAINASLDACLPLKFTGGLGGALAGRPIAIRYVDNRDLGKAVQTR
jgi:hypothetical protein